MPMHPDPDSGASKIRARRNTQRQADQDELAKLRAQVSRLLAYTRTLEDKLIAIERSAYKPRPPSPF